MISWIILNISTIIISAVLITVVTLIVVCMVKNKKKGNSSCGYGCGACSMSGSCHQKK